jgi:hypothetical protein
MDLVTQLRAVKGYKVNWWKSWRVEYQRGNTEMGIRGARAVVPLKR